MFGRKNKQIRKLQAALDAMESRMARKSRLIREQELMIQEAARRIENLEECRELLMLENERLAIKGESMTPAPEPDGNQ